MLIALIANLAASLTWELAGVSGGDGAVASVTTANGPLSKKGRVGMRTAKVSDSVDLHLFGNAGKVVVRDLNDEPTSAPQTTLSLVLKGIVFSSDTSRGLAIIAEKNKTQIDNVYGIGDQVPGDAVISEIYNDRVILLRNGQPETLMLIDVLVSESAPVRRSVSREKIRSTGDGNKFAINGSYLDERLQDIPSLAKEIGVEVYKEDGVSVGFKLISSRGSKLLTDLGLQAGDVLYEVNGVRLNSIHGGLEAYKRLKEASQVRVMIGRNGNRENRVYSINR